jgi:hypothetical protein
MRLQWRSAIPDEEKAPADGQRHTVKHGREMPRGQNYQRRFTEGTNIISFAYLFFR